ncbi:MAG: hypothetical protein NUW01_08200 [Gemmatimonadaceae bacterium]|nr:hypothetical protein [Gemmatimonadaceae bacterium]
MTLADDRNPLDLAEARGPLQNATLSSGAATKYAPPQHRRGSDGRYAHRWGYQMHLADGRQVERCDDCERYTLDGGASLVATGSLNYDTIIAEMIAAGRLPRPALDAIAALDREDVERAIVTLRVRAGALSVRRSWNLTAEACARVADALAEHLRERGDA